MTVGNETERSYLDSGGFRFYRILIALTLSLYGSFYLRESAGPALRLLLTVGFLAVLLGLNAWWARLAPEKRRLAWALSLAVVCTGSLRLFFPVSKSLIWLLLYLALFRLLDAALRRSAPRRVIRAATLLGLLFALLTVMGYQLSSHERLALLYWSEYGREQAFELLWFAGFALLLTALFLLLIPRLLRPDFTAETLEERGGFRKTAALAGGILLCWLPYFVIYYPGCLSGDSIVELMIQLGLRPMSDHHPVMHQLMVRLGLAVGGLFGSVSLGVAVYTLLQMLLMALAFALCLRYLKRAGAKKGMLTAAFLFYALYTINGYYSVTMWKDVPFAGVALLLVLALAGRLPWERVEGKGRRAAALAGFTVLCFLFCTLRNNGYYAFLLAFPFYILVNRRQWKPLLAAALATVLLVTGYHALLYDALGVRRSEAGEALSLPLQQIARTVKLYGADWDDEDIRVLSEVFVDIDSLGERYNSKISDPVKAWDSFRSAQFEKDPARYGKSWLRLGLRHPLTYVDAALIQCSGYWYPDLDYWNVLPWIEPNTLGLQHDARLAPVRDQLILLHDNLAVYRPTAILYSVGLMVWLELIAVVLLALKRQWRAVSASFPVWGLWLTTLASPVFCEYRYLYALVVTVPLFLGLALCLPAREAAAEPGKREGENDNG